MGKQLEVAIAGEGIVPATVPPRQVAELIEATVALYEALCGKPTGSEVPLALKEIRTGSCALAFEPSADAVRAVDLMYGAIKTRGAKSNPEVRNALRRLHAAGKMGALRVRVFGVKRQGRPRELWMSEPVSEPAAASSSTTTLHGRLVAVRRGRSGCEITLEPIEGGARIDLRIADDLVNKAAGLFDVDVEVSALTEHEDGSEVRTALEIEPFEEADLLEGLLELREELVAKGVGADPLALIEELD